MSMLGFLLKKKFYLNLGISVIVSLILVLLVMLYLRIYTHHGEAYVVPDFTGKTLDDLKQGNIDKTFDLLVIDSVYNRELPPGAVILQNPAPGSKVKKGRNIYLPVVAAAPEMTIMPDLKDLTLRQAVNALHARGLKVRKLKYVTSMAENAVLGYYFDNDTIVPGTELEKGSAIDLQLGLGQSQKAVVPFLIGLSPEEARLKIHLASLNVGVERFMDDSSPDSSKVFMQQPTWEDNNSKGDYVNLWYRSVLMVNFDSLIMVLNPDTLNNLPEVPISPEDTLYEEE
jgi:eukaryotic-like serine/threonine-protein kinase